MTRGRSCPDIRAPCKDHSAKISDYFAKPSYQIVVTHADGKEHSNVVYVGPEQKKGLEKSVKDLKRNMKKERFGDRDINALVAILTSGRNRYDAA